MGVFLTILDRLRKIRAVILHGDTTAARWWRRQYGDLHRDWLDAVSDRADSKRRARQLEDQIAALRAEIARLQTRQMRDAYGRFASKTVRNER